MLDLTKWTDKLRKPITNSFILGTSWSALDNQYMDLTPALVDYKKPFPLH